VAGSVSLAAFPSAGAGIVPGAWSALRRSAPHVQLDLHEMEPDESLPAVLRGGIDVAIAHEYDVLPRPLGPEYERRELADDPVLIAIHADRLADTSHRTGRAGAADGTLSVAELAGQPFLAPRSGTSCAEMTQRACARAGFVPRIVAHATDFQVLLGLVAVDAGVCLIPRLAARNIPADVRLMGPAEPITRRIFSVSRRGGDRKPAVRVVLDALAESAAAALAEAATRA
jgi:DNA-binding transcriptional LysR family regulator